MPTRVKFSKLGAKLWALASSNIRKSSVYKNSTYASENFRLSETSAFEFSHSVLSEEIKSRIVSSADSFINREIRVLSKQTVDISYRFKANDFQEVKHSSPKPFKNLNDYICDNVNKSNREKSLLAASKIDSKYIPIKWQRDFRSGYEWDVSIPGKQIGLGGNGADIKVPWEIGRMHQCLDLAMSYTITNHAKYASEFINCFYDFYVANPPGFGVQWKSAMDVAIRSVNLLVAFDIFRSGGFSFTKEFQTDFAASVFDHGSFIRRNLEWSGGMRGNHYLANLAGLAFCGLYLIESDDAKGWIKYVSRKLPTELEYQFLPDGGNFEDSTAYHFLGVELVFLPIILMKIKENPLVQNAISEDRLSQIVKFSKSILDRSYADPRFGDDDSGYLLKLNYSASPCSKHHQIGLINLLNDREINKIDLSKLINLRSEINESTQQAEIFKDFGIAVFKNTSYDLFFKCSKPGQNGKGGHSHNDMTSFSLSCKGFPVIVDPGTYVYTASDEQRNLYRSIESHNAIQINNHEPNTWKTNEIDDLFWMHREIKSASLEKVSDRTFSARYSFLSFDVCRVMELSDKTIQITDQISGAGNKTFRLHFSPKVKCQIINDNTLIIMIDELKLLITCSFKIALKDYKYSPSYGAGVNAKMIESITNMNKFNTRIDLS